MSNKVVAYSIPQAVKMTDRKIWNNGKLVIDQRGEATKELLNFEIYIKGGDISHGSKNPVIIRLDKDFENGLLNYEIAMQKGEDFDYGYGFNLRINNNLNKCIELLKENPETRRAYIPIYQPDDVNSDKEVPCWASVQFFVRDNKLVAISYFRSNECCIAICSDMYGIRKLQEYIANEIGVEIGDYIHHIGSAHLRLSDEDTIKRVVG